MRKPVRRVEMMESSDDEDPPPRRMARSHDGRLGQYSAAVPSNSALRESLLVQVRSERRSVCVCETVRKESEGSTGTVGSTE